MNIINSIQTLLLSIPGCLVAFTIYGFAQAYTADRLGDSTPRKLGRLTLNPMAHIDLIGFISILIFHFGWTKPFAFDTRNFKNIKRDNAITIISGPVATFITGVIMSFFYVLVIKNSMGNIVLEQLSFIFALAASICISLSIFYMLPLPGLDGYKLIKNYLPYKYYRSLYTIEKYSMFIFIIFLLVFAKYLAIPIGIIFNGLVFIWGIIL